MSTKTLRARLVKLERSAKTDDVKDQERKLPFEFPIDAALVKAIEEEDDFIKHIDGSQFLVESPLDEAIRRFKNRDLDTPDKSQARARIAELGKQIGCPPSYGFNEYWKDDERRREYREDEDDERRGNCLAEERSLIRARMLAYEQSPEGRARIRLDRLLFGPGLISPGQFEEIERLLKLYPEPWGPIDDRQRKIRERGTPADRKRLREKHERWIQQSEELRKAEKKPTRLYVQWQVAKYFDLLRAAGCRNLPPK